MKILSYDDLKPQKGIGYSKAQLWRLERAGAFPKRIRLGGNRLAWVDSEIDDWLKSRIADRDNGTDVVRQVPRKRGAAA